MNRSFRRTWKSIKRFWQSRKDDWNELILLFKPEHYPTWLSREFRPRYRLLTELQIIDEERKQRIDHKLVSRCFRKLTKLYFDEERLHQLVTILYRSALFIFILSIGVIYRIAATKTKALGSILYPVNFLEYMREFGIVIAFLLLYSLLIYLIAPRMSFRQLLGLYMIVLSSAVVYLSVPFSTHKIYAFGLTGFHIIILTAIGLNQLIRRRYDHYIYNNCPEAIIVFNLLLVMRRLDQGSLKSFFSKPMLVTRLEYAALFIEKYIYKILKTSDEGTNLWIMERTRQIADGIREKKKWVYTPKPDTAQKLAESLADFLICFLCNEWDSLERVEITKASQKKMNWVMQSYTTAQNLTFGLLPLGILLFLQKTDLVAIPISDSIIGIAVIWAIVSLLWLDPSAKDKISALTDATGILPSKS